MLNSFFKLREVFSQMLFTRLKTNYFLYNSLEIETLLMAEDCVKPDVHERGTFRIAIMVIYGRIMARTIIIGTRAELECLV